MNQYALRGYRAKILTLQQNDELRFWLDGLLIVNPEGQIVGIENFSNHTAPAVVCDLRPHLIVPGFVDTHLHFPQTRVIGRATGELLPWLQSTIFPEELRFRNMEYAKIVATEFCKKMISHGTIACGAYSSSNVNATHILFEALSRSGLYGVAGLTWMDQNAPPDLCVSEKKAAEHSKELITNWHMHDSGRLQFAITPRFAISCSRKLMESAAQIAADHALIVQTHVSENAHEGIETLKIHPYATSYVDVYRAVGLLTERTVLAHAIHLSDSEWTMIQMAKSKIAHCPDSNFFLGSGRMNLATSKKYRVNVALGSDVAAGRSFSIRRAMAFAFDNALCIGQRLDPKELFSMATLKGALLLGLQRMIGSLETGKDASFNVFEVPDWTEPIPDILLSQLIFAEDDMKLVSTYIRGHRLWDRYENYCDS